VEAYGLKKTETRDEKHLDALKKIADESKLIRPDIKVTSSRTIRAGIASGLALLSDIPEHDVERVAKDWTVAAAKAVVAHPEQALSVEAVQEQFEISEAHRKRDEDRWAGWQSQGWEDTRGWTGQQRTRVRPGVYGPAASGRWETYPDGRSEWIPTIQAEEPADEDQWRRAPWWAGRSGGSTWHSGWERDGYEPGDRWHNRGWRPSTNY